jgi:hypothetical protein
VYDLGVLPLASTVYSGQTGTGPFVDFFKFSFATSPVDASVTFSDSVRFSSYRISGGSLELFSCLTDCTGTGSAPTGSIIATAPIVDTGPTTQQASFGPQLLPTSGAYFLKLSGSTTAPGPAGVTYAGTISLSAAVPEPATWAMMLIGFAGLGMLSSRRRNALSLA